ncbi:unnamed protein product [Lathyrus oleraceus]
MRFGFDPKSWCCDCGYLYGLGHLNNQVSCVSNHLPVMLLVHGYYNLMVLFHGFVHTHYQSSYFLLKSRIFKPIVKTISNHFFKPFQSISSILNQSTNATSQSQSQSSFPNNTSAHKNSSQDAVTIPATNNTQIVKIEPSRVTNQTTNATVQGVAPVTPHQNLSSNSSLKGVDLNNYTASLAKKKNSEKNKYAELMESLMNCDFFYGEWVKDDSYPLYKPGSCSIIDEQFNCIRNGRPDKDYQQYKILSLL